MKFLTLLLSLCTGIAERDNLVQDYPVQDSPVQDNLVQEAPYDAIINLGGNCQPQYQLKINKLRRYALPFDHLITPFGSLYLLLISKFEDYLLPDNFVLKTTDKEKYIEDVRYGTRLMHDLKLEENFLDDFASFKEKYERRIKRLYDILATSKKVLFIRQRITREQALQLDELLSQLFPHLEYLIVALDGTEEINTDWQLPRVKNFFLRQMDPYVWSGDNGAWKEIFVAVHIESMMIDSPLQE